MKQQDDEIAKLQSDINNIQSYRQGVDSRADNLKLAQYQQQKQDATQLRETAEQQLIDKFGLTSDDLDIDIEACGLDYKKLASNYKEVEAILPFLRDRILNASLEELQNPESNFWADNVNFY